MLYTHVTTPRPCLRTAQRFDRLQLTDASKRTTIRNRHLLLVLSYYYYYTTTVLYHSAVSYSTSSRTAEHLYREYTRSSTHKRTLVGQLGLPDAFGLWTTNERNVQQVGCAAVVQYRCKRNNSITFLALKPRRVEASNAARGMIVEEANSSTAVVVVPPTYCCCCSTATGRRGLSRCCQPRLSRVHGVKEAQQLRYFSHGNDGQAQDRQERNPPLCQHLLSLYCWLGMEVRDFVLH